MPRKSITTKSGYKTHIDKYFITRNGKRYATVWGKTKAHNKALKICSNLFNQNKDKIEIVNEYTGEIFKMQ